MNHNETRPVRIGPPYTTEQIKESLFAASNIQLGDRMRWNLFGELNLENSFPGMTQIASYSDRHNRGEAIGVSRGHCRGQSLKWCLVRFQGKI
jgi:hypothetical protein